MAAHTIRFTVADANDFHAAEIEARRLIAQYTKWRPQKDVADIDDAVSSMTAEVVPVRHDGDRVTFTIHAAVTV